MNKIKMTAILSLSVLFSGLLLNVNAMNNRELTIEFDSGNKKLDDSFYKNFEKIKNNSFVTEFLHLYNENPDTWLSEVQNLEMPFSRDSKIDYFIQCLIVSEIMKENLTAYNYDWTISYEGKIKLSYFLGYSLQEQKELLFPEFFKFIFKNSCFSTNDELKNNEIINSMYVQYVFNQEEDTDQIIHGNVVVNNNTKIDDLKKFYPDIFEHNKGNEQINVLIGEYAENNNLINLCMNLLPIISSDKNMGAGNEITDTQLNCLSVILQCKNYLMSIRETAETILTSSL